MGTSSGGRAGGGARPPSSIDPAQRAKRKRGNRRPEIHDLLSQRGLKEDIARLRRIIAKGGDREALEAFKLLYGAPGDARRGEAKPPKKPGQASRIELPDV
jgi:hypothetical protein